MSAAPHSAPIVQATPPDLVGIVEFADAHCHDRPLCDTCALVLRSVEDELRRRQRVVDWLAELQVGQLRELAEMPA